VTGQNAIVLGGGCVGVLAVQCLRNIYGVDEVLVIDVDSEKLRRIPELFPEHKRKIRTLLVDEHTKDSEVFAKDWVRKFDAAYAPYLFEAMPPRVTIDSRELGTSLLAPNGQYILFTATASEERTAFFWNVLAKGINIRSSGFDQRCFPMPETAAIIQKAYAYASSGVVDLARAVTKEISFFDERAVQRAFASYGKGEHLWKTIVGIGET